MASGVGCRAKYPRVATSPPVAPIRNQSHQRLRVVSQSAQRKDKKRIRRLFHPLSCKNFRIFALKTCVTRKPRAVNKTKPRAVKALPDGSCAMIQLSHCAMISAQWRHGLVSSDNGLRPRALKTRSRPSISRACILTLSSKANSRSWSWTAVASVYRALRRAA